MCGLVGNTAATHSLLYLSAVGLYFLVYLSTLPTVSLLAVTIFSRTCRYNIGLSNLTISCQEVRLLPRKQLRSVQRRYYQHSKQLTLAMASFTRDLMSFKPCSKMYSIRLSQVSKHYAVPCMRCTRLLQELCTHTMETSVDMLSKRSRGQGAWHLTEVILFSRSVMEASASVRTLDLGVGRAAYAAAGPSRGLRYGVKSGMLATVVAVSLMLLASACVWQ